MCASSLDSSTSGYSSATESAESGEVGHKCVRVAGTRKICGGDLQRRKCALLQHHVKLHHHIRISNRHKQQCQQRKQLMVSAAAVEQLVALQHQYAAVAASYAKLQTDARVRNLRQRVARAKLQNSYTQAAQVLSQPRSQPQSPRQDEQPEMWQQQQAGLPTPSLPALTLVVKMLLQLASAKASPSLAVQLRQQLLQQVKAAAAAAKNSSQEFSVAATVHSMLPGLRAAVLQACRQQEAAAASTAAVVEAALTSAACEVRLCSLALGGQQQQELAPQDRHACHRASDLAMDIDELLQAEMASAMSAQL